MTNLRTRRRQGRGKSRPDVAQGFTAKGPNSENTDPPNASKASGIQFTPRLSVFQSLSLENGTF